MRLSRSTGGISRAGDMLVFNDAEERDGYAMTAETFDRLYEPAD